MLYRTKLIRKSRLKFLTLPQTALGTILCNRSNRHPELLLHRRFRSYSVNPLQVYKDEARSFGFANPTQSSSFYPLFRLVSPDVFEVPTRIGAILATAWRCPYSETAIWIRYSQ